MLEKYSNMSDEELHINLSKKKKIAEPSFAELYSRHSAKVYAYCKKVVGNKEDINDIFQEAFTRFYNQAKQNSRAIDNVENYLMAITRNLCLNYKRDLKNFTEFDMESVAFYDHTNEEIELTEIIDLVIETMEFTTKEAFILRVYHGYSYAEISEITNQPISILKNKVWRAKEKVRDALAPYISNNENNN